MSDVALPARVGGGGEPELVDAFEARALEVAASAAAPNTRRAYATAYGRRDIPLSPGLAAKLKLAQPPDAHGRLAFTTTGTRLDRHNLATNVLGRAATATGLDWVTLHTFRHTCASLLFAPAEHGGGGKNAKQVQEWLGHHSPAYTLREYIHLIDAGVGDTDFLDAATG